MVGISKLAVLLVGLDRPSSHFEAVRELVQDIEIVRSVNEVVVVGLVEGVGKPRVVGDPPGDGLGEVASTSDGAELHEDRDVVADLVTAGDLACGSR